MVTINGVKFACERCIRGHRVSGCTHVDSPLRQVKRKGRPPAKNSSVQKQRLPSDSGSLRRSSALHSCEDLTQLRQERPDFSLITNLSPERVQELRSDPSVEIYLPGGTLLGPSFNTHMRPRKSQSRDDRVAIDPESASVPHSTILPPVPALPPKESLPPLVSPKQENIDLLTNMPSLHAELHPELHPELHRIPPPIDISKDISPRMSMAYRLLPEYLSLPPVFPDRRSTYSPRTQQARSDANVSFFRHIDSTAGDDEEHIEAFNDEDDLLSSDRVRYKKNTIYNFLSSAESSPVDPQAPPRYSMPSHQPYTPTSQIDAGVKFELASDIAVEPNELTNSLIDYTPQSSKPYTPPETMTADNDIFSSNQIKLSHLY